MTLQLNLNSLVRFSVRGMFIIFSSAKVCTWYLDTLAPTSQKFGPHLHLFSTILYLTLLQPSIKGLFLICVCIWITRNILIEDSCLTAVLLSRSNYYFSCFEKIFYLYKYLCNHTYRNKL